MTFDSNLVIIGLKLSALWTLLRLFTRYLIHEITYHPPWFWKEWPERRKVSELVCLVLLTASFGTASWLAIFRYLLIETTNVSEDLFVFLFFLSVTGMALIAIEEVTRRIAHFVGWK